ncbi:MAG: thioredoxin family protein [Rhodocyclales bacterium]|nr:thioredoxin family protein [Rhodocyclales bacterium]MBI5784075.1 thioredoxin family protein [Rhodocyclales bacterium]
MRHCLFLIALLLAACSPKAPGPYDERADARAALQSAQAAAAAANQPVFVVFGANWCEDCRALDKAMHAEPSASLIARSFQVVKIDVGNFDRNQDIVATYDNPTRKGIPAAVLLSPDGKTLYATRAGELSSARRMGADGIHQFLTGVADRGVRRD